MMADMSLRVGVVGASGYAGVELLRLLAGHPSLTVAYPTLRLASYDAAELAGLDLVFTSLPSGVTAAVVPDLVSKVGHVVDLAADFRLRDPALYPQWYGWEHPAPALLAEAAFGLPELFRSEVAEAALVAAPGCYVTAA